MSYASRQFNQAVVIGIAFTTLAVAALDNMPLKPMPYVAALPKMADPLGLRDERLIVDLEFRKHLEAHPVRHKKDQPYQGGADALVWSFAEK